MNNFCTRELYKVYRRGKKFSPVIRRAHPSKIKMSLTTTITTRRPATPSGRQSEQQNKGDCGAGVIDMLCAQPSSLPPQLTLSPSSLPFYARSLARSRCGVVGVYSFFLLILLFPQTGSQALIQRHWLPHGNPPPVLCERPSERGGEIPRALLSPSSPAARLVRNDAFPPFSASSSIPRAALVSSVTFSYSATRLEPRHDGNAYFYASIETLHSASAGFTFSTSVGCILKLLFNLILFSFFISAIFLLTLRICHSVFEQVYFLKNCFN